MTSLGFGATSKFNKSLVIDEVRNMALPALYRMGGYMMRIARREFKFRQNPDIHSAPGDPPFTHGSRRLPHSIGFAVQPESMSVIVGPGAFEAKQVGHVHEWGGEEERRDPSINNWILAVGGHGPVDFRYGQKRRASGKLGPAREQYFFGKLSSEKQVDRARRLGDQMISEAEGRGPQVLEPRPYMAPTLEIASVRLSGFWAGAVVQSA
jgi:hypothetical protein